MSAHLLQLDRALVRASYQPNQRITVEMPPRHGKSTLASVYFPAWYRMKFPKRNLMLWSATGRLAQRFSTHARELCGLPLDDRTHSWEHWKIDGTGPNEGEFYSAGVGGGSTMGAGFHLGVIDDYFKDVEAALSEVQRQKLIEWYLTSCITRAEPGASLIVIACMTGDTEVTMADGSVTQLRDIKVGDAIATYEDGKITTSRVLNWINHGPDSVYAIRMSSGKTVKANYRHPFLVCRGSEAKWVRLRDLRRGDCLLRIGRSVAHGAVSPVTMKGAISRQDARVIASPTTTKRGGPVDTVPHPATMKDRGMPTLSIGTASLSLSTMPWPTSREAGVPSAARCPMMGQARLRQTRRMGGFLSIIATPQARSADCCVMNVISELPILAQRNYCNWPLDTFAGDPDRIVEIIPAGIEDVFDIEVDRTENFIANGVVSHNTRWHRDDLIGFIRANAEELGEQWEHIRLPAINDDGAALWPEQWPIQALERKRKQYALSGYPWMWDALYQQEPPEILDSEWDPHYFGKHIMFDQWPPMEETRFRIMTLDPSVGHNNKTDYSAITLASVTTSGHVYIEADIQRRDAERQVNEVLALAHGFGAQTIGIEYTGFQAVLQHMFARRCKEIGYYPLIHGIHTKKDKRMKIRGAVTPFLSRGFLKFKSQSPGTSLMLEQLRGFPTHKFDDGPDSLAMALELAAHVANFGLYEINDDQPVEMIGVES